MVTAKVIAKSIWDVEVTSFRTIIRINILDGDLSPQPRGFEKKALGSLSLLDRVKGERYEIVF